MGIQNKKVVECDAAGGVGAVTSGDCSTPVSGPGFNTCNNTPGIGNAVVGGSDRWDNVVFSGTSKQTTSKKNYFKIRKKKKKNTKKNKI